MIYIFNCRLISFLIFLVMIIRLKIECASSILETWLCCSFFISKLQRSTFSSSSLTMIEKEHSICLFESCRRCFFTRSWDFLSRSQIIHVLYLTFNLNFFVRFNTIAYSSRLACSLRKRIRSSKSSKVRSLKKEDKIIVSKRWNVDEKWDENEIAEFSKTSSISRIACSNRDKRRDKRECFIQFD